METEAEIDWEVMFGVSEDIACEHIDHDVDTKSHDGVAQWYVVMKRDCCGITETMTFCDPYVKMRMNHSHLNYTFGCMRCGGDLHSKDAFIRFERIDKG